MSLRKRKPFSMRLPDYVLLLRGQHSFETGGRAYPLLPRMLLTQLLSLILYPLRTISVESFMIPICTQTTSSPGRLRCIDCEPKREGSALHCEIQCVAYAPGGFVQYNAPGCSGVFVAPSPALVVPVPISPGPPWQPKRRTLSRQVRSC